MADIAVSVALYFADHVLSILNKGGQRNLCDDVEALKRRLRGIQAYVRENEERKVSREQIKEAQEIAYDIEDALDEFLLHAPYNTHHHAVTRFASQKAHYVRHRSANSELCDRAKAIRLKLEDFIRFYSLPVGNVVHSVEGESSGESSVTARESIEVSFAEEKFEGYEEPTMNLRNLLMNGDSSKLMISVVGTTGSGKSMLVKNVSECGQVQERFDCRAWLHLSRTSVPGELLRSILKQFHGGWEETISQRQEGIGTELRTYVQDKRYLVVLDNAWIKDHVEQVVNSLPPGSGGSRIIVTTQNSAVTSNVSVPGHIVELKGLPWRESWTLFCTKVFGTKCPPPPHLEDFSENIVKRCEGLPFAIAAVGNYLAKKNEDLMEWKALHDSLESDIRISSKSLSGINRFLMPSYLDLPSTHKSCLLYFSIFPEDHCVNRERLIRSWVAEGFVDQREVTRKKTVEQIAESYLNELVARYLVSVTEHEINGRVKSCRLLNLHHGFIISKAEDNNFVTILAEPNQISSGSDEKVRRLSFQQSSKIPSSSMDGCLKRVRTAFMFTQEKDQISQSNINSILHKFRLLRVLDLQDAPLQSFPDEIVKLRLLRYLSLRHTQIKEVPRSVKNLAFLETLDLKQTHVTILPVEILELPKLRHLLAYRNNGRINVTFESVQGVRISTGIAGLPVIRENLIGRTSVMQKLKLISLKGCQQRLVKELDNFIHLRKLGLVDVKKEYGKKLCEAIQKMQNLSTLNLRATSEDEFLDLDHMQNPPPYLHRLYLKGRFKNFPRWISKLQCLLKIGLMWSKSSDNPLHLLEDLPNLMEIKMVDCYDGDKLEFRLDTFKKLKTLHLERLAQLNTVVVFRRTMPMLEKLTIFKCEKLKILPLGIQNLSHLGELLLFDMNKEFISRVKKNGGDRWMVEHVKVIHSLTLEIGQSRWSFDNLS